LWLKGNNQWQQHQPQQQHFKQLQQQQQHCRLTLVGRVGVVAVAAAEEEAETVGVVEGWVESKSNSSSKKQQRQQDIKFTEYAEEQRLRQYCCT
jgi:hypothetical protein